VFHAVTTRSQVNECTVRAVVQVKQATADEVTVITTAFWRLNVVPVRDLRSYAGKCTAMASVISTWTPFLKPLWAALTVEPSRSDGVPRNCVWVRQFSDSLEWVVAFLTSEGELSQRVYESETYFGYGKKVDIDLDASP